MRDGEVNVSPLQPLQVLRIRVAGVAELRGSPELPGTEGSAIVLFLFTLHAVEIAVAVAELLSML